MHGPKQTMEQDFARQKIVDSYIGITKKRRIATLHNWNSARHQAQ